MKGPVIAVAIAACLLLSFLSLSVPNPGSLHRIINNWNVAMLPQYSNPTQILRQRQPYKYQNLTLLVHVKNISLLFCPIHKNMGSQTMALLVNYAMGKQYNLSQWGEVYSMWNFFLYANFTGGIDIIQSLPMPKRLANVRTKLAIIRDPIDRFLSAYLFICKIRKICDDPKVLFNCRKDLFCLLGNLTNLLSTGDWPTFRTDFALGHLTPQSFYCNFQQEKSAYQLIMYGRDEMFKRTITDYLGHQGIPKKFFFGDSNSSAWLSTQTHHTTATKADLKRLRKQLLNNILIVNEIYRVYRIDYDFFQLKVPQSYKNKCNDSKYEHLEICKAN